MSFVKATKTKSRLRLALYGPSGGGKTYTALKLAAALGRPVAVIDTERGSASKYAGDVAEFDVLELTSFEPSKYVRAIADAANARYATLVIDSLSHAWMGKGGLLDQADARGGRFDAWKSLTPMQHALIDAILAYPGDVIVTMRTKTEYIVEKDSNGKAVPRKVGMAPIQKDGVEYEFDVAASMSIVAGENVMTVDKSRCPGLSGAVIRQPGKDVADTLRAWLSDGATAVPKAEPQDENSAERQNVIALIRSGFAAAKDEAKLREWGAIAKQAQEEGVISQDDRDGLAREFNQRRAELRGANQPEPASEMAAGAP